MPPNPTKRKRPRVEAKGGGGSGGLDDDDDDDSKSQSSSRNRSHERGGEESGNDDAPPKYHPESPAREVFRHPYFYGGSQAAADCHEAARRRAIPESMTVGELRELYASEFGDQWVATLADRIVAPNLRVDAYFAGGSAPTELVLNRESVIPINGRRELKRFKERGALPLRTLNDVFQLPRAEDNSTRDMPVSIVTGSSGSGKTFFCLQYLTDFLKGEQKYSTALYLQPDPTVTKIDFGVPPDVVHAALLAYIRSALKMRFGELDFTAKLNMHVSVIIDEAGGSDLNGHFEDKAFLKGLWEHLEDHLATNVSLVVSGTGLTGTNLTSSGDAFIFRLGPWVQHDVEELVKQQSRKLVLKAGETVKSVVDAIFKHPKLRGLTTNARSAYCLVRAIASLCSHYVADAWSVQLDAWAPALVTTVVHQYIAGNGLRTLDVDERRVVAASVFRALEDAASWNPEAGAMAFDPPAFERLEGKPLAMAKSLVTWNVERVDAKEDGETILQLVDKEPRVISVTPAIATVLFVMAGVQVSMIRGWRAEKEVAALYAARQGILRCFDRLQGEKERLKDELRKIRLYELRKQIQPFRQVAATQTDAAKKTRQSRVRVPIVSESPVLLNGDKASFADVIAPYMLLQAKHTSGKQVKVDIEQELGKCCLLERCRNNNQVLRGLLAVWSGTVAASFSARQEESATAARVHNPHGMSNAYPENMIKYGDPVDSVRYAFIERGASVIKAGDQKLKLPDFKGEGICFVISTNAEVIDLVDIDIELGDSQASKDDVLNVQAEDGSRIDSDAEDAATVGGGVAPSPRKRSLKVTPDMLDPDLQLKAGSLGEFEVKWNELKKTVISGVKIKFLFTAMARHLAQDS
jgi:hypothetical protein